MSYTDPGQPDRIFQHPNNGYEESIPRLAWLYTLLFGAFYLAARSVWKHVAIICAAIVAMALAIPILLIPAGLVMWIIYAIKAQDIIAANYLRRGWNEVTPA